jgi:acyl carrier protein
VTLNELKNAFVEALNVSIDRVDDNLAYGSAGWDSLAHMVLVAKIETAFNIMLDTDEVIGMSDFSKAKEILVRHGVPLESV